MTERSACRRGWPQIDCLPGNGSGGVPNDVDQSVRSESRNESIGQVHEDKICSWRERVPAAEARKAGTASEVTVLTPRPPCLIGKDACSHWVSDRAEFVMQLTADLRRSSKICREKLLLLLILVLLLSVSSYNDHCVRYKSAFTRVGECWSRLHVQNKKPLTQCSVLYWCFLVQSVCDVSVVIKVHVVRCVVSVHVTCTCLMHLKMHFA